MVSQFAIKYKIEPSIHQPGLFYTVEEALSMIKRSGAEKQKAAQHKYYWTCSTGHE